MRKVNPIFAKRPLLRLRGYDYAQAGVYFVTLRTFEGRPLFGHIHNGIMCLSEMGAMAHNFWNEIPKHFSFVKLDEFNVLPNHIHGVLVFENYIEDAVARVGSQGALPAVSAARSRGDTGGFSTCDQPELGVVLLAALSEAFTTFGPLRKHALGTVVHAFKSSFKRWCNRNGHTDFKWLPRFYDHIIHTDESLQRIRHYVHHNTLKHSPD